MHFTATYSPDDNKLRLEASTRLDADLYERVRAAGFRWAPKQAQFIAPMWTPEREDLCIELAETIEDDDRTLADRADERAERFEGYRENRAADYERAHAAVSAIADNIPLGQPILVGHHSERHARRDAERIDNGMRRAVRMWDTAQYWQRRAAAALRHAKYKERPDVRARRIKTIEADRRRVEKNRAHTAAALAFWQSYTPETHPRDRVLAFLNVHDHGRVTLPGGGESWSGWSALHDEKITIEEIRAQRLAGPLAGYLARADRWLAHYDHRLTYERAMLAESGGLAAERFDLQPGGRVQVRGEWATILRVNRTAGVVSSVRTNARYVSLRSVEEITAYEPPTADQAAAVKAATKLPPLVNVRMDGARDMTAAEWKRIGNDYKGTAVAPATAEHGAFRYRVAIGPRFSRGPVFLTDEAEKPRPAPVATAAAPAVAPAFRAPRVLAAPAVEAPAEAAAELAPAVTPAPPSIDALRAALAAGPARVVTVPALFPTPAEVAARVIELADIGPADRVLEPSAGTGALLTAIGARPGQTTAIDIHAACVEILKTRFPHATIHHADFLTIDPAAIGPVDRVVMNPPFDHGADVAHIRQARALLAPGGKLVAICANGPRQQAALRADASAWIDLPAGTFAGTGVRAAIVVLAAA